MTTTYEILVDGEKVAEMTADFAQAASPLLLDGDSTPFQVADARHRTQRAAEMLLSWRGGDVTGDVTVEEIETADAE